MIHSEARVYAHEGKSRVPASNRGHGRERIFRCGRQHAAHRTARPLTRAGPARAGKAEFLNPGGSVKDRAARGIVDDAEARGALQPGGTIVEGTAGNTGIALALVANERGYKSVIVVPGDQSREKIELLRAYGSDVRVVPAVAFANPENYYHVARRIAEEIPGCFLGESIRECREPPGARGHDRPGDLGTDQRPHRRIRLRRRVPAELSPGRERAQEAKRRYSHRALRSDGLGPLQLRD